jgi:exonuclease III
MSTMINNNKEHLKIAHLNISSIAQTTKQLILNDYIIKENIQILSINETYLKQKHKFDLEGYCIYRYDRVDKRKGGAALVIAKSIQHENIQIENDPKSEIVAVKIQINNIEITIVSYYVPPNEKINTELY